jgi:hypothetical protein
MPVILTSTGASPLVPQAPEFIFDEAIATFFMQIPYRRSSQVSFAKGALTDEAGELNMCTKPLRRSVRFLTGVRGVRDCNTVKLPRKLGAKPQTIVQLPNPMVASESYSLRLLSRGQFLAIPDVAQEFDCRWVALVPCLCFWW